MIKDFGNASVLSIPPSWILRSGISIIAVACILAITLMSLISYEDTIYAQTIVRSNIPPVRVKSQSTGVIEEIYFQSGDTVNQNSRILVFKNSTDFMVVDTVREYIIKIDSLITNRKLTLLPELRISSFALGELSNEFSQLKKSIGQYNLLVRSQRIDSRAKNIREKLFFLDNRQILLQEELNLAIEQSDLMNKNYSRSKKLNETKMLSDNTLELEKIKVIDSKRQSQNTLLAINTTKIQIEDLNNQLTQIELDFYGSNHKNLLEIEESLLALKGKIERLEDLYVLKAPTDGIIQYDAVYYQNQPVNRGSNLFTMLPIAEKAIMLATCYIPTTGSGDVSVSTPLEIRLHNFPYQINGVVEAKIKKISVVPSLFDQPFLAKDQMYYRADVELPKVLTTNIGITLPYKEEITGTAVITTERTTVINRLFSKLLNRK